MQEDPLKVSVADKQSAVEAVGPVTRAGPVGRRPEIIRLEILGHNDELLANIVAVVRRTFRRR